MAETKVKISQTETTSSKAEIDSLTGKMGAWANWSPAFGNLGAGASTFEGSYLQIGKTVFFRGSGTIGAGGGVFGNVTLSLPVAVHRGSGGGHLYHIGAVNMRDANGSFWHGWLCADGEILVEGTNGGWVVVNATVPFTWAVGDIIEISGCYEAA